MLASLATMLWNPPSKSWTGGATMGDASLNRRMTVRLGDAVAFAQLGIVGLDGQIELEALRLYGLPEARRRCSAAPWSVTWSASPTGAASSTPPSQRSLRAAALLPPGLPA